jgi:N4-bis(aminopropyl)spermidine synthase
MQDEIKTYLARIARDIDLDEGVNGIKDILIELHRLGNASVKTLADSTRLPPPAISLVLTKLSDDGLIDRNKSGVRYTEQGIKYVESEMGILSLKTVWCEACDGRGIEIAPDQRHTQLVERLEEIAAARPEADVTLDQAKCTVETIARRLIFLHEWHAFDGKDILFLGDDDFISVATVMPEFLQDYFISDASIARTPFSVTVIDVDDRILGKIGALARQEKARELRTVNHDIRQPLPPELLHRFDVIFTDPPYTVNGCKLFLSRAIDALREEKGSKIFLSFGHLPPVLMKDIQKMILDAGLVIESLIPAFNEYEGGNIIGNMSQMMVLCAGEEVHPPHPTRDEFTDDIYTAIKPES